MALRPIEIYEMGGVDSRSNPANPNSHNAIKLRNWNQREDASYELRRGYTQIPLAGGGLVAGTAIHSMYSFQGPTGGRKLFFWQGTTPYVLDLSTGAVAPATVKGQPIESSARWSYEKSAGRLYMVNGTDAKWFDGSILRDLGLPDLGKDTVIAKDGSSVNLPDLFANVTVTAGARELSTAENAAIVLSAVAGGNFPKSSTVGWGVYFSVLDTANNELGPATQYASGARLVFGAANEKVSVSGLPNFSSAQPTWILLPHMSIQDGGGGSEFIQLAGGIGIQSIGFDDINGVCNIVLGVGHGFVNGDVVYLDNTGVPAYDRQPFFVNVVNPTTLNITAPAGAVSTAGGGFASKIQSVPSGTTTCNIISPLFQAGGYRSVFCNEKWGIDVTVSAGYAFYVSIYNRVGGGHVGNRIVLGNSSLNRLVNTTRCNVHIKNLPALDDLLDDEYSALFGRTADGGQVPYISSGFGLGAPWNSSSWAPLIVLTLMNIDAQLQMPFRNGRIPAGMTSIWRASDRLYAAGGNSATVALSGSDADAQNTSFVGDPAQSWDPADDATFPTADFIVGGASYSDESWLFTSSDMGILGDPDIAPGWQGPWLKGIAGPRAFTRGWKNNPYWVTAEKELATMTSEGPISISGEYERALLSKIGDPFLASTEVAYRVDVEEHAEILHIKCRDANGVPFFVVHDFRQRDQENPYGKGREGVYSGDLSPDHQLAVVRDQNGKLRIWAASANGKLLQLYDGDDDNGATFAADGIALVYAGLQKTAVNRLCWVGDAKVRWFIGRNMAATWHLANFEEVTKKAASPLPGHEKTNDAHWYVDLPKPVASMFYVWFQLISHPQDGSVLALSDPPHLPLETYGHIYGIIPMVGESQGNL